MREAFTVEVEGLSVGAPVEVVAQVDFGSGSPASSAEEVASVKVDDVVFEGEGAMWFGAGEGDLSFFAVGEDIVFDDIVPAVVLMEGSVADPVDEVVLEKDAGAALVGVKAPSTIAGGEDIVDVVVPDDRSFGLPEGVNSAHVAEDAVADMMEVVVFDTIAFGIAGSVSPNPTGGDGGVVKVGDIAVANDVIAAASDPDAGGTGGVAASAMDDAIVDGDMTGAGGVREGSGFANTNPTHPEVEDSGVSYRAMLCTFAKPKGGASDIFDGAVLEGDLFGIADPNRSSIDGDGGLGGRNSGWGSKEFAVAEVQVFEGEMSDRFVRRARDLNEIFDSGRHDLNSAHVFAFTRVVVEPAVTIEKPFAGRVERAEEVFKIVEAVAGHLVPALHHRAVRDELALLGRHGLEKLPSGIPFVENKDLNIFEFLLIQICERGEVSGGNFEGVFDPFVLEWFFNDIEEGIEVPPVGSAGPDGATSIDPEVFEAREGGDFGFPNSGAVEINDPISDARATTDFGIAFRLIDDGCLSGSGVRRVKDERFGESMATGEESDGHTILRVFSMLRPRGLLCMGQSSKGLGLCSQMLVISIRRNE